MKPIHAAPGYALFFSSISDGNVDERFGPNALQNRTRILKEAGVKQLVWMRAIGGTDFADVSSGQDVIPDVDALISTTLQPNAALALSPADCIPIVLWSASTHLFALLHVGRRNAEAGIIGKIFDHIKKAYPSALNDMIVFLGPSIQEDSYYFSSLDVNQLSDPRWQKHIVCRNKLYYIDLPGFAVDRLIEQGVRREAIQQSTIDTGSDTKYFSHARSARTGEPEGRNLCILKAL